MDSKSTMDQSPSPRLEALGRRLRAPFSYLVATARQDPTKQPETAPIRIVRRVLESQFARFCVVGASGYTVNLAVYAALLAAGLQYLAAAAVSFLVAAASNYVGNRIWTFRAYASPVARQSARAVLVSALSLAANQLFLLVLVSADATHMVGQAIAIVLVTPFSFAANKLWAFADNPRSPTDQPYPGPTRPLDPPAPRVGDPSDNYRVESPSEAH